MDDELKKGLFRRHRSYGTAHRYARDQERDLAKRGNGLQTPGSGNKAEKGDVKRYRGVGRIEAKSTKRKSFSITQEMLDKIRDAALAHNELPIVQVDFLDEYGQVTDSVAVLSLSDLDELLTR